MAVPAAGGLLQATDESVVHVTEKHAVRPRFAVGVRFVAVPKSTPCRVSTLSPDAAVL